MTPTETQNTEDATSETASSLLFWSWIQGISIVYSEHIYITTFWSLFLKNKKHILTSIYSFLIYHASFCKAIQIIHLNFFPGYICDSKIYIPELFVFRLYTFVQSPGNLLGMGRGKERRSQYILLYTIIKIKFKIIFKQIEIKLVLLEYLFSTGTGDYIFNIRSVSTFYPTLNSFLEKTKSNFHNKNLSSIDNNQHSYHKFQKTLYNMSE